MRSTLFYLPHSLFGLPVLGFGWLLGILCLLVSLWAWFNYTRFKSWKQLQESLPVWFVGALLIAFLFPRMESLDPNGNPIGLPIRGYGVMLMLGALSGLALTLRRAQPLGLSMDHLLSLATWGFIPGILGARVFYVIQKWGELPGSDFSSKMMKALQLTEGGLVVYGGIIGGLLGTMAWCLRRKLPPLAIADLVVPGFFLGLAFGRIGCLLHGCCFGGVCWNENLPHIRFPSGSEPYLVQLERGDLLGVTYRTGSSPGNQIIESVREGSWASQVPLKPGQVIQSIDYRLEWPSDGRDLAGPQVVSLRRLIVDGRTIYDAGIQLPSTTLPLHPAQIYSSINALLLCIVLYLAWPIPKHDGYIFAAALSLYAIVRILEEIIRADELGQFGTTLTISQWISIVGLGLAVVVVWFQRKSPRTTHYRFATTQPVQA